MTIGTALVIIAILYLIDKHNLWKRFAIVCLTALAVTLGVAAGYYAWQTWQERKDQAKVQAELKAQWVDWEPTWSAPPPPKGFSFDDVAEDILYPVKAEDNVKTDAWKWYRDSGCVSDNPPPAAMTGVLHNPDLFILGSYDPKWMSSIALPPEVKRALWSAKVAECRLQPGAKKIQACLDRATGNVLVIPNPAKSCAPLEMVLLNSALLGSTNEKTSPEPK